MSTSMKIVAFLQNAWFSPGTRDEYISRYLSDDDFHRRVLARGYSGRRILRICGEKIFQKIVWQNVSLEVGAKSDHCGKPDLEHVKSVMYRHKPDLILTFGSVALGALNFLYSQGRINVPIFSTKHPNARHFPDAELTKFFEQVVLFIDNEED